MEKNKSNRVITGFEIMDFKEFKKRYLKDWERDDLKSRIKNSTKAKVEYMDFKDFAKLLIKRGYGDLYFSATFSEILENLKFKSSEETKFDPINGIRKMAANVLSKIKGNNNDKILNENQSLEMDER